MTMRLTWPQAHGFHLVDMSPWPYLFSLDLGFMALAVAAYFGGYIPFIITTLAIITATTVVALWLRSVTIEATLQGSHTEEVQALHSAGFTLFLVTETMLFVAIFWSYLHSALAPVIELGAQWPPTGIQAMDPFEVPLANTVLLLASATTITMAHHGLIAAHRGLVLTGFALTIVLAVVFTALQGYEYATATFTMSDSVYGSAFFLGTGVHGFHVILGTTMLTIAGIRFYTYQLTSDHHLGFASAIVYWHLVDVVWLALWVMAYWWAA